MTSKGWETDSLSAHLQPPPPYNPRVIHCFGRWGAAGLLAGLPLTEAPPYAVPYVSFLSAALTSERRLSAVGASWRTVRPEGLRTLMQSGVKSKRSTSTHPCQAVPYCLTYIKKTPRKAKTLVLTVSLVTSVPRRLLVRASLTFRQRSARFVSAQPNEGRAWKHDDENTSPTDKRESKKVSFTPHKGQRWSSAERDAPLIHELRGQPDTAADSSGRSLSFPVNITEERSFLHTIPIWVQIHFSPKASPLGSVMRARLSCVWNVEVEAAEQDVSVAGIPLRPSSHVRSCRWMGKHHPTPSTQNKRGNRCFIRTSSKAYSKELHSFELLNSSNSAPQTETEPNHENAQDQ